MRDFGDVATVKILLEQHSEVPRKIRFEPAQDPWQAATIREGQKLCKFVQAVISEAVDNYYQQIQKDHSNGARAIDIRHPVRLSGGIRNAIRLLETVEPILDQFEESFEILNSKAEFSQNDIYEELAKDTLNFQDTIIPRIRLYVHAQLWFLWVVESFNHAARFHGLMKRDNDFEELTSNSFPYISHPPLIVVIIACSTMIEEVGARWLNAYVDGVHHKIDETSVGCIIGDIEAHYAQSDTYNLGEIKRWIVDTRNEISHYVTRRGDTVKLDELEEFKMAVTQGIELVASLLSDLVLPPIEEFQNDLSRVSNYTQ
ncbi:hypothetical protein [Halorubrum sp. CBA1229]|uniref:hypothetical protein n=1 Tax=Halorubrum sp. CBA1229 TaxID=1853699 RepID=UPI0011CD52FA|nr:hypothetical protein [Halorubrum sp. CBA1229]QKY18289.1 hypothetical protein Hrr1229_015875 [Halorubrum sp. CBA1229]